MERSPFSAATIAKARSSLHVSRARYRRSWSARSPRKVRGHSRAFGGDQGAPRPSPKAPHRFEH
eukprot:1668147-Lingulodinium_polyedra.AAC.1